MHEPDPTQRQDDSAEQSAIRAAFLVALLEDRERGRDFEVSHYQRRFRGFENVIAAEYAAFDAGPVEAEREDVGGRPAYRIDGELGRGGMGVVQRVFDPTLQRYLARKVARHGAGDAETARFFEEARVTAQLDHPGIVAVHEFGRDDDGCPYFTMPMVRGRNFAELIRELHGNAPTQWARIVEVLVKVCDTVAFAHSRGVVHRDLKPQNVMVGRFGEVFVVDWGLARALGRPVANEPSEHASDTGEIDPPSTGESEVPARGISADTPVWTLAGDVLGTPAYMAPEQLVRSDEVSCKVDVYAIGAILYHAIASHPPYDGQGAANDSRSVIEQVAAGPPAPIATRAHEAPPELFAVCEQAMSRDPQHRYPDAAALRDDLRAFADGRVVGAYEHGKWAELRKWIRRNRAVTAAAVTSVVALIVALVFSLIQADRAESSFHDSVAAVDRMLTRVARAKLRNVPETTAIRRDLLADATGFFEGFLAKRPNDPELRQQAAISYYRVATLHDELGDHESARNSNARSRELLALALEREPQDPDLLYHTARAYLQLGSQLSDRDDNTALATALEFAERRLATDRGSEPLALAGTVHDALALANYRQRDLDQAEHHARASIALREELVRSFGEGFLGQAGNPHSLLAGVYSERKDLAGCIEQLERAIALRRRYLELFPDETLARSKLAETLRNQAVLLHQLRREPAAEASAAEAVALRAGVVRQSPRVPKHHVNHANELVHQARIRYENGGTDDAAELTDKAFDVLARARTLEPGNRRAMSVRFEAHSMRYRIAARQRDHAALAANAVALREFARSPAPAAWRFEAACQLAVAVQYVDAAGIAAENKEALRREYAERAVNWLRTLVADDALPNERLADSRLDPLRAFADFPTSR